MSAEFVPKPLEKTADISKGKFKIHDWVKGLASIAILLFVGYLLLGAIADGIANSISEETEAELFDWVELGQENGNHPEFARVQSIFDRLVEDADLRPLPYRLVLFDEMEAANAFAVPGGLIGVTPGLLDEVESEIGLAFVLAHELGHHQHRHALKRLGRTLIYRFALSALGGSGDLSLLENSVSLATLKHSRDQEREADQFGLALVYKVYGTTEGAYEFFEQMHAEYGSGTRLGAMFQTHPLTEERIEDLKAEAQKLGYVSY